jgi:hypothetical protein
MKKLVVALAALALASPALAQESRPSFGIGVSVSPLGPSTVLPTTEVYLALQLAPQLRIEPSIGILTRDEPAGGNDTSDITVGVGVLFTQRVAPAADVYVGGRLKLNPASLEEDVVGGADDSGTDLVLAAAVGGEYYLAPRFSLGAEGQLGFYDTNDASANGDASGVFTNGLAFVRFYF